MVIKKKIYIFLGPPGSGKGTQTDMVGEKFKIPVISIGELLRFEIHKKTKLGLSIKSKLSRGTLISDKMAGNILEKRLKKRDTKNGFVLDGFPRRKEQAIFIKNRFKKNDIVKVFYIDVCDKEVKRRIGGRRVCDCGASYHLIHNPPKIKNICDLCNKKIYAREDDKSKIISLRLIKFHKRIKPILEYFSSNAILYKLDGKRDIKKVYREILKKIETS